MKNIRIGLASAMGIMALFASAGYGAEAMYLDFDRYAGNDSQYKGNIVFKTCTMPTATNHVKYACMPLGDQNGYTASEIEGITDHLADQGFGLPIDHDKLRNHPLAASICGAVPGVAAGVTTTVIAGFNILAGMGAGYGAAALGDGACAGTIHLNNYIQNLRLPKEVRQTYQGRYRTMVDALKIASNPGLDLSGNKKYNYALVSEENSDYIERLGEELIKAKYRRGNVVVSTQPAVATAPAKAAITEQDIGPASLTPRQAQEVE